MAEVASMQGAKIDSARDLVQDYIHLTKVVLPALAQSDARDWPVSEDHCFQRIVLDAICGGVWYEHLDRPAYKHLTRDQAQRAIQLCHEIVKGRADLWQLNHQSLIWRGKRKAPQTSPTKE
ncbi:MAG: hypothetical protein AAGD43_18320 [Pseudomonadota bacterium]